MAEGIPLTAQVAVVLLRPVLQGLATPSQTRAAWKVVRQEIDSSHLSHNLSLHCGVAAAGEFSSQPQSLYRNRVRGTHAIYSWNKAGHYCIGSCDGDMDGMPSDTTCGAALKGAHRLCE
jgi:hypothetical protein